MRKFKWLGGFAAFLFLFSVNLRAETTFTITPGTTDWSSISGGDATIEAALDSAVTDLYTSLETTVQALISDVNQQSFLKSMSDTGIMAHKGVGVDYASNYDIFSVGAGLSVGIPGISKLSNSNNFKVSDGLPAIGFGAQVSFMLGLNLGAFSKTLDRFRPSMKVFKLNLDFNDVSLDFFNIGFYLQFKVLKPIPMLPKIFSWGGLDVSAGYEFASMKVNFSSDFNQSSNITESNSGAVLVATWDGSGQIGAKNSLSSIPIDISTNLQLLYLTTLYGGIGFDFNFGSTSTLVDVNGDISVTQQGSTTELTSATGVLGLSDSAGPGVFHFRYFGGIQFNIWLLKLYAQYSHSTAGTDGITLGTRIVW